MFESFVAAGWKGRLLNLALWALFFASLSGVGIGIFGVLAEATLDDQYNSIVQLYWSGMQAEETWITYATMGTSLGDTCTTGGRGFVALCLIALWPILLATILSSIRLFGLHVSFLQPPSKWINVELGATVLGALTMTMALAVWGATCYQKSASELPLIAEMTPTGYVWSDDGNANAFAAISDSNPAVRQSQWISLVALFVLASYARRVGLCCGYLWLNVLGYLLIRRDPQGCRLGSIYGSELSEGNRPMTGPSASYAASDASHASPERIKIDSDDVAPLDMEEANEL